jgi:hypothetical protein
MKVTKVTRHFNQKDGTYTISQEDVSLPEVPQGVTTTREQFPDGTLRITEDTRYVTDEDPEDAYRRRDADPDEISYGAM